MEQIGIIGWRVLKAANDNRKEKGAGSKPDQQSPSQTPDGLGSRTAGDVDAQGGKRAK